MTRAKSAGTTARDTAGANPPEGDAVENDVARVDLVGPDLTAADAGTAPTGPVAAASTVDVVSPLARTVAVPDAGRCVS
jgi:hypothetical protein